MFYLSEGNMTKFTAIVVTYNEASHLNECLAALDFCEEKIVIDLGSTDKSKEIATSLGFQIISHKRVEIVEQIRAWAISQAHNDWIVFMDPDEIFPKEAIPEINASINRGNIWGFAFPRINYFLGVPVKHGRWYGKSCFPRIFHKDSIQLSTSVHDGLKRRPECKYKKMGQTIKHYWIDSMEQFYEKHLRYIKFEGESRFKRGIRYSLFKMYKNLAINFIAWHLINHGFLDKKNGWKLTKLALWYEKNAWLSLRDYERLNLFRKKEAVILNHNGGRLANQLWNFISIYAYCLEHNYDCKNYCFFEYSHYFKNNKILVPTSGSRLLNFIYIAVRRLLSEKIARRMVRAIYRPYELAVIALRAKRIIRLTSTENARNEFYHLPPTSPSKKALKKLEDSRYKRIYFQGWRFRNKLGIEKFHQEISQIIVPKNKQEIDSFINGALGNDQILVGVHVRHGDYASWKNGEHYFSFDQVKKILENYLEYAGQIDGNKIKFLICSDDKIDAGALAGLNYVPGPGSEISDLYALSKTNLIIGSLSTYGALAAYLGNIPFFYFRREGMRWDKPDNIHELI